MLFKNKKKENQIRFAKEKGANYFAEGYNCAQSVLLSGSKALEIELPPKFIDGTLGFSGGIGFSGNVCGALIGGVTLIGIALGKSKKKEIWRRSNHLQKFFQKSFGSHLCQVIRQGGSFHDKKTKGICQKIVSETAGETVKLILS